MKKSIIEEAIKIENMNKGIVEADESDEKAVALANELGIDVEDIEEASYHTYGLTTYEADGDKYVVGTEEEAYEVAKQSIKDFIDDVGWYGLSQFTKDWAINNALETDWFEEYERESHEFYWDELDETEQEDTGYDNASDYADSLMSGDSVEWYEDNFGTEALKSTVKNNNLVDVDAVAEMVVDTDGVAHVLASYDGAELDLGNNLYAYRR